MCTVSSGYGHIIYLFTNLLLSPLEGAHAAEVRGDSAAIALYWSEGVRSNIPTISHCDHILSFRSHTRTLHWCVCARGVAHFRCAVVSSGPPARTLWLVCHVWGVACTFLGYLLWQARACMCGVSSGHAHIIYLFTHILSPQLE